MIIKKNSHKKVIWHRPFMRTMTTTKEHLCPAQPVQAGLDKQAVG